MRTAAAWESGLRPEFDAGIMRMVPADLQHSIRSRRGRPDCALLHALAEVCVDPGLDPVTAVGALDSGGVCGGLSPSVKENRGLRALVRERLRRLPARDQMFALAGDDVLAARELRAVAAGLRLLGVYACAVRGTLAACPCLAALAHETAPDHLVDFLTCAAHQWQG